MSGDERASGRGGGAIPGALHIVSTPIGNLADLSPRAAAVLSEADLVVAEDSRVARTLLESHGIKRTVESLPAFDERGRVAPIVERLASGASVALISDAGTPLVSDPGNHLVEAAIAAGVRIVPVPGASALLAALVASGVAGARWSFEGFLPRSGATRQRALGAIAADERATIVYEAGSRVAETLRDLARVCGDDRRAALCRELTKIHEEVRRGSLGELATSAANGEIDGRGEFVIVVGSDESAGVATAKGGADDGPYRAALDAVASAQRAGASRSDAVRRVAAEWGLERRRLWSLAHEQDDEAE